MAVRGFQLRVKRDKHVDDVMDGLREATKEGQVLSYIVRAWSKAQQTRLLLSWRENVIEANAPSLRVLMAQLEVCLLDPGANLDRLEAIVRNRCSRSVDPEEGIDMVITPECFLQGYGFGPLPSNDPASLEPVKVHMLEVAERCDGPAFARVSKLAAAAGISIVYGFIEKDDDNNVFIAMNWVDPQGDLKHTYRKTHPWVHSRFERVFSRGDSLSPVFEVNKVRVALMICWDLELPEPARCLSLAGAQALLVMGANMDTSVLTDLVPTRAAENLCHVLYVNNTRAAAQDVEFCGMSTAANPLGEVTSCLPADKQAVQVTEIRPENAAFVRQRERCPQFQTRRPELYTQLLK
eukprot:TRINITY_DN3431_c0_g4_i1.p1 TRINITY_DN3431_c0_g4~~TRINITY_DN3431_c0_g4_i1.p1  ORF type:complete len:351 (-),score=74.31 TRINITY_DN3431_c0_g4_i1:159-1211(-)